MFRSVRSNVVRRFIMDRAPGKPRHRAIAAVIFIDISQPLEEESMRSIFVAAVIMLAASQVWAQPAWKPERQVELVLPTAPGGGNDAVGRLMQKVLTEQKILPTPLIVINKSGGNQTLSLSYVMQHAADPHYLLFSTSSLFTNYLQGLTTTHYSELPALGLAFVDYSSFMVPANSPLKTMSDLIARLKAEPDSVAFSVISRGGTSHAALAQAARSAGIDPKRLKVVVYKTSAEATTAMMGNHIQAAVSSAAGSTPQVVAGHIRMLAISAPQRRTGALAQVPTLAELGLDATGLATWRGIFGAKGISAAQVAYWEDALARAFASEDWRNHMAENNVTAPAIRGRELSKYLAEQFANTRSVLVEMGLAK
jgi:putative tricarboxylic transport membrane protein